MVARFDEADIWKKVNKDICIKITTLLSNVEMKIDDLDCQEAVEILSLLVDFKEFFTSEELWESYVYSILEIIQSGIYNAAYRTFSFFHGITDIAFLIRRFLHYIPGLQRFLYGLEKLQLGYLDDFLQIYEKSSTTFKNNYYELISGITSPTRYWLDVESSEAHDVVIRMINFLIKNGSPKTIINNRVLGWHYYPLEYEAKYMAYPAPNGCINYGVSHGMGGPLQVLALAYHRGIRCNGLLETIQTLIGEYKRSAYYINNIIYWPGRITVEEYINPDRINKLPNRMSWCYGSVGILRVLYLASRWISDKETEIFSKKELLKIANLNIERYGLELPILCHGYAGVAAIMNEMYRDTGEDLFRQKMIELIMKTNNLMKENIEDIPEIENYSYLDGQSGVLQTIYYIITNRKNDNLKRLLII